MNSLEKQCSSLATHVPKDSFLISINETGPTNNWELPLIDSKDIYKVKWIKYFFLFHQNVFNRYLVIVGDES